MVLHDIQVVPAIISNHTRTLSWAFHIIHIASKSCPNRSQRHPLSHISRLPSLTPINALSQSPQYPLIQASISFFPFLPSSPSIVPTRPHLCVSFRSQLSYSASTISFSMRLTTRSATKRSCRWDPKFWRVRWRRRGAWTDGEIGVDGLALGSVRREAKVWWLW